MMTEQKPLVHGLGTKSYSEWVTSDWYPSDVSQGSILSPVLFKIFINDLDRGLEYTLSKFRDDTKLGDAVDSCEGREALLRDLNQVEVWANTRHMKFNKEKYQILHEGQSNPKYRQE